METLRSRSHLHSMHLEVYIMYGSIHCHAWNMQNSCMDNSDLIEDEGPLWLRKKSVAGEFAKKLSTSCKIILLPRIPRRNLARFLLKIHFLQGLLFTVRILQGIQLLARSFKKCNNGLHFRLNQACMKLNVVDHRPHSK